MAEKLNWVLAWAPINPNGLIMFGFIERTKRDAVARLVHNTQPRDWRSLRKEGWRVVRVVVSEWKNGHGAPLSPRGDEASS